MDKKVLALLKLDAESFDIDMQSVAKFLRGIGAQDQEETPIHMPPLDLDGMTIWLDSDNTCTHDRRTILRF